MKYSIMQEDKKCYVCGTINNLDFHHIFFGANRKISDDNGFAVWLCAMHHTGSNSGVHCKGGHALNMKLKQECQAKYEETHTRQEFRNLIGKSYL